MDQDIIRDFVLNFLGIVWEALPFIIFGALIAGILEEFLPQEAITKFLPKHFVPAVMIGAALGLIFPMCECGIVVVMRRLLRKGLPLSCCIAYMLAGPIVNPIVLFSTAVAFYPHTTVDGTSLAWHMVIGRAGLGFLIACLAGFIVHFLDRKMPRGSLLTAIAQPPQEKKTHSLNVVSTTPAPKKPLVKRIANISNTALKDFIDITVFLIIGSVLAAFVRADPLLVQKLEVMSKQEPLFAVPLMMALAFVLCLCSEADAFLAASFKGMSISAKLAFLVFGPMLDIKLVLMYTRVFRLKLIATIVISVTLLTLFFCTLVHLTIPDPEILGVQSIVTESEVNTPAPETPKTPE